MNTLRMLAGIAMAAGSLLLCSYTAAHHSVGAWFERGGFQEIEGVITEVRWQNPHVLFFMRAPKAGGEAAIWEIETYSIAGIQRWGITEDLLRVGDTVRVSGWPSKRGLENIFARNVLLPSGTELTFGAEPIYSDDAIVSNERFNAVEGVAADADRGIFRVWSQARNARWLFPEGFVPGFDIRSYPLNDAAWAAYESFDYLEQDPTIDCRPKGMPVIMEQPYPMEFTDAGDRILLHIEEYDQIRTIYMRDVPNEAEQPHSLHGFSVGRMDGRDLIVTTSKINSGTFDSVGIPLSLEAWLEERFAPSPDGATLDYSLTIHDPVYLTAPVETGKQFIYRPEVEVRPFDCQRQ
ncbi:MAG: DUF6152 family protein [Gammaproteobacteria bacterium]|jgi:hypothetical protein